MQTRGPCSPSMRARHGASAPGRLWSRCLCCSIWIECIACTCLPHLHPGFVCNIQDRMRCMCWQDADADAKPMRTKRALTARGKRAVADEKQVHAQLYGCHLGTQA